MNISVRSLTFALAFAASMLAAPLARAQTVIDTLPYVISSPGAYVLNSNLNSPQITGYLITVNASNVTLDFQGHYIAGPVGNTNQNTVGVNAYEQSNVTIKNGTIAYCYEGLNINGNNSTTTNSVGHQVDNMRVTYCYNTGIRIDASPASRITNCQVSQIGFSGTSLPTGIMAIGVGIVVSNNVVSTVTGNNSYGIHSFTGSFARQNTVSNCYYGVAGGKYQDNLTANCVTAFSDGTDAGGNN